MEYEKILNEKFSETGISDIIANYVYDLEWLFIIDDMYNYNWDVISKHINLTEKFMDAHTDKLNWKIICQYQPLTEKYMLKKKKYMYWDIVVHFQLNLSERFLKRIIKLNKSIWFEISTFQNISEKFIQKHNKYVVWYALLKNRNIKLSKKFKKYCEKKDKYDIQKKYAEQIFFNL